MPIYYLQKIASIENQSEEKGMIMNYRQTYPIITAVALMCLVSGCISRAAREGIGAVRGGRGTWIVLDSGKTVQLDSYKRFELGNFTDGMHGKAPSELLAYLPAEFEKALADKKIPNAPDGKTLLIRGKILHYEDASLLGEIISPLEEVVARVEFVDKDTGKVICVANCVGRTRESINSGIRTKAQGLARAIVGWIDHHYPKDKRIRE